MALRPSHLTRIFVGLAIGVTICMAADEVFPTGTPIGWRQHSGKRPKAPVVEPVLGGESTPAPKDAVILFDGKNLDQWQSGKGRPAGWKIDGNVLEVAPGSGGIETKGQFGDIQLHVEWTSPSPARGKGQDRGNSGIFLMGLYEVQVLDSYQADSYADGQAGAIYGQYPPLFNATRPPGEWQTYEIAFRRERFDASGKSIDPARVTLFHNGILVQNNEQILGVTSWLRWSESETIHDRGPIKLQDHGHPVRFRNIWLRELPERPRPISRELDAKKVVLAAKDLDPFVGDYVQNAKNPREKWLIRKGDGHLLMTTPYGPTVYRLDSIGPETFEMTETDGRIIFERDADGKFFRANFEVGGEGRQLSKLQP